MRPRILKFGSSALGGAEALRRAAAIAREELPGGGLIVVSSELPEILALADRVLVMCEGRQTAEFARTDATPEKILAAAFPTKTATAA